MRGLLAWCVSLSAPYLGVYLGPISQVEISDAALASRLSAFDGDYAMRSGRGPHDAPGHMVDVTLVFTSEAVARRALTNLGGGDRGRFRVVTPAWASAGAPAKGVREISAAMSGDPISGDLGGPRCVRGCAGGKEKEKALKEKGSPKEKMMDAGTRSRLLLLAISAINARKTLGE